MLVSVQNTELGYGGAFLHQPTLSLSERQLLSFEFGLLLFLGWT